MQSQPNHGKMLTVVDGYLVCPNCNRNRRLLKIRSDTDAKNLIVYCKICRHENLIDISKGQCHESQSQ